MSDIEGVGFGRQQWSNIAPEPPPAAAGELAAAERDLRNARFKQCDRGSIERVMAEYDRRADTLELNAERIRQYRIQERELRADLARAQRIVAAAERVVAKWESMHNCYQSTEESVQLADLLDALAREVRGGQE